MRSLTAIAILAALTTVSASAQDETTELTPSQLLTALEENPLLSARAAGLSGALITLADSTDAGIINPAGVGGLDVGEKLPFIRQLHFLRVGVSANDQFQKWVSDFQKMDADQSDALGRAVIEAYAGQRKYGRLSIAPNIILGRLMIAPYSDQQIAAVAHGEGSGIIDFHYRTSRGAVVAISARDPQGRIHLGASAQYASISEVNAAVPYESISTMTRRTRELRDLTGAYSGTALQAGIIWRLSDKGTPRLGAVLRHIGDTTYESSKEAFAEKVIKQNLDLGLSVSPRLKRFGLLHFSANALGVLDDTVALTKKYRLGTEYIFGGDGALSVFALRAGYSSAGLSFGGHLNLGLLALEYASESYDFGIANRSTSERRTTVILSVNVAEYPSSMRQGLESLLPKWLIPYNSFRGP